MPRAPPSLNAAPKCFNAVYFGARYLPSGCQAGCAKRTSEEAEYDQRLEALGAAARGVKDGEGQKGKAEHVAATKDLGAWCPNERANDEA